MTGKVVEERTCNVCGHACIRLGDDPDTFPDSTYGYARVVDWQCSEGCTCTMRGCIPQDAKYGTAEGTVT